MDAIQWVRSIDGVLLSNVRALADSEVGPAWPAAPLSLGGAAGAGRQRQRVLDPVGQALNVEWVARDGLAKLGGGTGELAEDQ